MQKRSMIAATLFAVVFFVSTGCDEDPESVLLSYLDSQKTADKSKAMSFLCDEDQRYLSSSEEGKKKRSPVSVAIAKRSKYKIKKVEKNGMKATVYIEVKEPDYDFRAVWDRTYKVFKSDTSEVIDIELVKEIMSDSVPIKKEEEKYELVKEQGGWKVKIDFKGIKEKLDREERKQKLERYTEASKQRGINVAGKDLDSIHKELCKKLNDKLPLRGEFRKSSIETNELIYDCPDPGAAKIPETGYWQFSETVSIVDDTKTLILRLESNPDNADSPSFIIRCKRGKIESFVHTEDFLSSYSQTLMFRFDREEAQKKVVRTSSNYNSLFFPQPHEFISSMFGKKKLLMRYTTHSKGEREIVFDIVGIENAVEPIRELCKLPKAKSSSKFRE